MVQDVRHGLIQAEQEPRDMLLGNALLQALRFEPCRRAPLSDPWARTVSSSGRGSAFMGLDSRSVCTAQSRDVESRQFRMKFLRTAYWHDRAARQAFKDFIFQIHRMDFTRWENAGYWDDDYSPYSYFVGDRVVSSLCIYTMHARVNGRACKVAQISGVGTLPEYRRQGLSRSLHEIALPKALAEHSFAFLYSDDEAVRSTNTAAFVPCPCTRSSSRCGGEAGWRGREARSGGRHGTRLASSAWPRRARRSRRCSRRRTPSW
jgi:GNAT superfamily N-acetyltransferase